MSAGAWEYSTEGELVAEMLETGQGRWEPPEIRAARARIAHVEANHWGYTSEDSEAARLIRSYEEGTGAEGRPTGFGSRRIDDSKPPSFKPMSLEDQIILTTMYRDRKVREARDLMERAVETINDAAAYDHQLEELRKELEARGDS